MKQQPSERMAYKEKKTMVRINPAIARHLSAAARLENMRDYQLLEKIALAYLEEEHPEIYKRLRKDQEESKEE